MQKQVIKVASVQKMQTKKRENSTNFASYVSSDRGLPTLKFVDGSANGNLHKYNAFPT